MKQLRPLIFLLFLHSQIFGHGKLAYIEAKPVSCQNLTYEIIVHYSLTRGSDVLFNSFSLSYGDGVYDNFGAPQEDQIFINKDQVYYKIIKNHSYSGPGKYTISIRIHPRNGNIQNMDNSVNTPIYVETTIVIDPILGCNSTPGIKNIPTFIHKNQLKYSFDPCFEDNENDSISFSLTHAFQDKNLETINFEIASEYDESEFRKLSRLSIDPYTGSLLWNKKISEGDYCVALKIYEWRKVNGTYFKISQSTLDYVVGFVDTENNAPEISGLKDTVLIVGNSYSNTITLADPEADSIQMLIHGEFAKILDNPHSNDFDFFPGPLNYNFNFSPATKHVQSKPYKLLISGTDQNSKYVVLNNTETMHIWITDRTHEPEKPQSMLAQALNKNLVGVYWKDVDDELGYILERADLHSPNFEKIAILPANRAHFNDSSVVENNEYEYRVKAVGTQMSDYASAKVATPDIVTEISADPREEKIKVYPNPCRREFTIVNIDAFSSLEILDITGTKVFTANISNSNLETFFPNLSSGLYVVNLSGSQESKQLKLEIIQ